MLFLMHRTGGKTVWGTVLRVASCYERSELQTCDQCQRFYAGQN
jgi:hypothetical protein